MAEFCKKCFKEKLTTSSDNISDNALIMSKENDYCESCGEFGPVVLAVKEGEN